MPYYSLIIGIPRAVHFASWYCLVTLHWKSPFWYVTNVRLSTSP